MNRRAFLMTAVAGPVLAALQPAALPAPFVAVADVSDFLPLGQFVYRDLDQYVLGVKRSGEVSFTVNWEDL